MTNMFIEIDSIIHCFSCVAQMPEVDSAGPGFSSGESERLLVSNGKQVTLLTLMKMLSNVNVSIITDCFFKHLAP